MLTKDIILNVERKFVMGAKPDLDVSNSKSGRTLQNLQIQHLWIQTILIGVGVG
jgi:hypothetical protein